MAAIDFPSDPIVDETFTSGSRTWKWNGSSWVALSVAVGPTGPTGPAGPQGETGTSGGVAAEEWTDITAVEDIDFSTPMQKIYLTTNWTPEFVNIPAYPEVGQVTLFCELGASVTFTSPAGAIWLTSEPTPVNGEWFLVEFVTINGRVCASLIGSGDDADPFRESSTPSWRAFDWLASWEPVNGYVDDGEASYKIRDTANRYDMFMPVAASRPIYRESHAKLNGMPALEFDGSNDYMRAYGMSIPQPFSIVAVVQSDQADYVGNFFGVNSGSNDRAAGITSSGNGQWRAFASGSGNSGGQPVVDGRYLVEAYFNGTSSYIYVNGYKITSGISPGTAGMDQFVMGAGWAGLPGNFWDGSIGLLAVYDGEIRSASGWSTVRDDVISDFDISYQASPIVSSPSTFGWYMDLEADTSAASNGSSVEGIWVDQSGNGNHQYQDYVGYRPLMVSSLAAVNGQKGFDFNGSSHHFFNRTIADITGQWSALLVVVPDNADQAGRYLGTSDGGSTRGVGQSTTSTGRFNAALGGTGTLEASQPVVNTGYMVEFHSNGGSSTLIVNGTIVATGSAGASPTVNMLTIGSGFTTSSGAAGFFDGKICVVKIFNGGFHQNQVGWAAVYSALKTKYGFSF